MLELIQGEGGVNVATQEFITGLRKLCDNQNILLIFDEVQTGIGRTGKMFGFEHYDIKPDVLTLGKGVGGGFPMSAMLCPEKLNIFEPGDQGGTYTGQPLAMAVGLAVLNEIESANVLENCQQQSEFILGELKRLAQSYPIKNIRGKGLLLAFDIDNAQDVSKRCMEKGLLINAPKPYSIRLMPPLIVSKEDNQKMLEILESSDFYLVFISILQVIAVAVIGYMVGGIVNEPFIGMAVLLAFLLIWYISSSKRLQEKVRANVLNETTVLPLTYESNQLRDAILQQQIQLLDGRERRQSLVDTLQASSEALPDGVIVINAGWVLIG